jgi:Tfp pilus assembly protein PilZ
VALKGTDRYVLEGALCRLDGQVLHVMNLSASGLFVAAETPLPAGQRIELELALPGQPPFRVLGKVTWVNDTLSRKAPQLPCGFGVQMTRIAPADKQKILEALKHARAMESRRTPPRVTRPR